MIMFIYIIQRRVSYIYTHTYILPRVCTSAENDTFNMLSMVRIESVLQMITVGQPEFNSDQHTCIQLI